MTPHAAPRVTIVMYHYVRQLVGSRFPRLAALELDAFRSQVEYVQRHYSPVSPDDLVGAATTATDLPKRPVVLTFDDGYADHYRNVFPLLRDRKIPAVLFPAAMSLVDRGVLDVNKIQFILAATPSENVLVELIENAVLSADHRADVRAINAYRADGWKKIRYDTAAVSYVKYMLQRALPADIRTTLVDDLFARFVSSDERSFASELYFSIEDAREMAGSGMTIGCHADRHVTLTSLTREGQAREIDGALRVLDALKLPRSPLFFSYAKGAYNADTLSLLRARNCALAVTNRPEIATLNSGTLLELPRLDANHLPIISDAPPNEWTMKA